MVGACHDVKKKAELIKIAHLEFGRFLRGLYKEYGVEFTQKGYTLSKRIKEEDMKKLIVLSADALVAEDME